MTHKQELEMRSKTLVLLATLIVFLGLIFWLRDTPPKKQYIKTEEIIVRCARNTINLKDCYHPVIINSGFEKEPVRII